MEHQVKNDDIPFVWTNASDDGVFCGRAIYMEHRTNISVEYMYRMQLVLRPQYQHLHYHMGKRGLD
jgi:hypothetical protein